MRGRIWEEKRVLWFAGAGDPTVSMSILSGLDGSNLATSSN